MKASSVPTKFPIPWGNSAGAGYIRPIPTASQIGIQNGAASLTDGFPPLTFLATAAGGVPPFGQDANGILKQTTQWNQWQQAGGPLFWDATFSTEISGYPQGSVVQSNATLGLFWLSTVDDNTTNPDSGGAGWQALPRLPGNQTWTGTNTFTGEIEANGSGTGLSVASNVTVGGLATIGDASVSGNITVGNGAYGSGNSFRVVNLGDFANSFNGQPWYQRLPNGTIIQGGQQNTTGNNTTVTFPISFPNYCGGVYVNEGGGGTWVQPTPLPTLYAASGLATGAASIICLIWNGNSVPGWVGGSSGRTFNWLAVGH